MKNVNKLMAVILLSAVTVVSAAEYKVPKGYRATVVTVPLAEVMQVKSGDRVDVLVTMSPGPAKGLITATILQNVLVLDTVNKAGISSVVLALNPNEAEYAVLGLSDKYRINIIIRGKDDIEMHPMEVATFRRLFFGNASDEKTPEKENTGEAEKTEQP